MSDIDDRLRQKPTHKPKRPVSAGFTDAVMKGISKPAKAPAKGQVLLAVRRMFSMRLLSKPAGIAAGVAVLTITAGTAYATLQWLRPNTQVIGDVTTLSNGNKRFWLHSDACQGQDMKLPVDSYYEIKAGAKTTPEQIRASVESGCEDDLLEQLFADQIKASSYPKGTTPTFKPGDKQYFFPYALLKSVGEGYIVVDGKLNGVTYKNVKLPLVDGAKIYTKGEAINARDLVPGKWLTLVTATTELDKPFDDAALVPGKLEEVAVNGFPRGAKVEGIIQREYNVDQAMESMGAMGKEWTRLVKDDKSPDGWKQLIPLDGNWENYNQ